MNLPMHADAERDKDKAIEWYEERSPRVAVRFIEALTAAIDAITANPQRYPLAEDAPEGREVRNYLLLPKFPFLVVSLVTESRIVVVAVAHTSRGRIIGITDYPRTEGKK